MAEGTSEYLITRSRSTPVNPSANEKLSDWSNNKVSGIRSLELKPFGSGLMVDPGIRFIGTTSEAKAGDKTAVRVATMAKKRQSVFILFSPTLYRAIL
jgi:hypothetical protein